MASQPVLKIQETDKQVEVIAADKWLRVAAYVIDVVPALVLGLIALIPIVGIIFAGLLLGPYWLLRDVGGRSLGKLLLGMKIVLHNGKPAPAGARVLRNLPLIAAPICMLIPLLGYFLAPVVGIIVILVEGIMLLTQGSRLGDNLAGTVVVKSKSM